ncbi:MAG: FISUMP domain-containing protein [Bacteroidales bacterium]|jgi:uncharacterized protein (TIGR02145 family)
MKKILLFLWTGILLYSCTPQETPTTLKDKRDGKVYNTVTIGSQVWMAENLAYLPSVSSPDKGSGTKPHYYVYNFNGKSGFVAKFTTQYRDYGVLYNWAAAMAGSEGGDSSQGNVRGICPEGWHLPSDAEWEQLETYLAYNGYRYANVIGGTVRDKIAIALASVTGWSSSNEEGAPGNNDYPEYRAKSGFNARPGGYRSTNGTFGGIDKYGNWWSSTEQVAAMAWSRFLFYDFDYVARGGNDKEYGFSVRCVKD